MVNHTCPNCNKIFTKKSSFITHVEHKKNPCGDKKHNYSKIFQNIPKNEKNAIIIEEKVNNTCLYCKKIFSTKFNLNKHIRNNCKVKKLENEEKEKIFNILLKKDKEINELKELIKQQSKNYEDKINKILDKVSIKNINKGIINNITISPTKLVKFGSEDVSKIDTKFFTTAINKFGKDCFLEIANKIYNNDIYPQYKTIYMNDKNRNQFMTWNGEIWTLNDSKVLYIVVEKLREFIDIKNDEIEDKIKNNPMLQDKIKTRLMTYYNMYFDETNDATPERKKEFQNMLDKSLIKFLYNIKERIKDNYNNLLEKAQQEGIIIK
jgi:hypothetical protein